jgi:hypothetical protein
VDVHFEALFGTTEFKKAPQAGDPARGQFLHDLYEKQLTEVCGFPYVQSFEMVNNLGKTGCYLFYCSRNITGLKIMKEAMWKVAPGGDFKFSDRLAGQSILFEESIDTRPLQANLMDHFAGRTVSIADIENYTLVHTPYAKSHVKTRTLKPMQEAGLIDSPNQRRAGTFPEGTLVTFPSRR